MVEENDPLTQTVIGLAIEDHEAQLLAYMKPSGIQF